MLTVNKLSSGYGNGDVVQEVSLTAKDGEFFCIVGPNGCGKTTLLRAIAALLPFAGEVMLDGKEVARMKRREIAQNIAFLTQFTDVAFPYTVFETVMTGRYPHRSGVFQGPTEEDREIVRQCLSTCDIREIAQRPITELSGGQLQRVLFAKALCQDPKVILLDEPTNHMDITHQIGLMRQLRDWAKEKNRIVVGVLHDLNLTLEAADRVLMLREGRAVAEGACGEVFTAQNLLETYGADIRSWMLSALDRWQSLS